MRPEKTPIVILTILTISLLLFLPAVSADGETSKGDVGLIPYDKDIRINAGSSDTFRIEVTNYLDYAGNNIENYRMVSFVFGSPSDITVSVSNADKDFVLEGQKYRSIIVTVEVDKYATAAEYDIGLSLEIRSLSGDPESVITDPVYIKLTVMSPLSSGDSYNKIMGIFENPLPAPFNGPITSAVITFLIWLLIGTLVVMIAVPLLMRVFMRKHKDEGEQLRNELKTFIPMVLILFAFDSSLRVFGASEEIIGSVESWFNIFYIALGAIISWRFYLIFVQYAVSKISDNKRIDKKDMDIGPLLRLLGKLVIAVLAITLIMATLGFNLTAIITSAGVVSLGITLGAQNILNQFFSGMVLLITHPFRSGDLVKIGASSTIYKVSSVNIMNTVFENWDNEETVIMPNNAVSSSTIVNLTGDGLIYKVTVFMNIAYSNDIDLARDLMKDVAMNHPNVITNGSVDMPSTRVTAFLDSSIELRLTGYVYDFNDSGRIGGELREAIFKSFKKNGIDVPFPQMDVHLNVVTREDLNKDKKE